MTLGSVRTTWMTTTAVAAVLGCTPRHVRRLAHDRHIRHARASPRRLLFDPDDVVRYAELTVVEPIVSTTS